MAETTVAPNNKAVTFGSKVHREPAGVKLKKPGVRNGAKRAMKRGLISQKAAKKHLGGL